MQSLLSVAVLLDRGNQHRPSTSPLRRLSGARVWHKKSTHSSQSASSSATQIASGRRVNHIASNSRGGAYACASCYVPFCGRRITVSMSCDGAGAPGDDLKHQHVRQRRLLNTRRRLLAHSHPCKRVEYWKIGVIFCADHGVGHPSGRGAKHKYRSRSG